MESITGNLFELLKYFHVSLTLELENIHAVGFDVGISWMFCEMETELVSSCVCVPTDLLT